MRKRILSMLLCIVLCLSLLPIMAFAATSYTVTFDANYGGGAMQSVQVECDRNGFAIFYFPKCEFKAPEGKWFGHWEVDGDATQYSIGSGINLTQDVTVKPVWIDAGAENENYYTVTFLPNGGSGTMPKEQVLPSLAEFGNLSWIYTFPKCDFTAPSGYMFDKWEDVDDGVQYETGTEVGLFKNITVKPSWVEAPIVPTPTNLCWNGTTASWENVDSSVTYFAVLHKDGDTSEIAIKYVKGEGFVDFADAINQNGEGNYYFDVSGYMRLNNMDFYSETATSASKRFPTSTIYTVSFNMNGHGDQVADQMVNAGEKVTEPAEPTATGYIFGGWYKDSSFATAWNFDTDTVTADTTLYALWVQNTLPNTPYNVWVSGVQATSANKDNILGDSGTPTATYDPESKTLTLNGAQITQTHEDNEDNEDNEDVGGAIYAKQALTVKVIGESSISLGQYAMGDGIYTTGNLTITGDESLNITTGYEYAYPVWVNGGKLTVNMNGNLTVNAAGTALSATGSVMISGSGSVEISAGADRWSGVYSSGGDVTLSGSGDVMIDAGYGIYAQTGKAELAGNGSVAITSKINGVFASGDVVFSGDGDASISGEEDAVKLKGTVLLNGTGSPISIKAGTGYKAVLNSRTWESPVDGTNLAYYNDVTGKPEEQSVVYKHTEVGPPSLPIAITSVAVTGMPTTLTVGESTTISASDITITTVPADADYTVKEIYWYKSTEEGSDKEFKADNQYSLVVVLSPGEGYCFKFNGTFVHYYTGNATFNGEEPHVAWADEDGLALRMVSERMDTTKPEAETYTVTFNMNGHGTQVEAQTVKEGEKATKPANPTASGYTFDGWYADATFSAVFDFNTAINADTTIYAKWTQNTTPPTTTYTIIAGANGEWTKGSTTGLAFTSDAPFDKFDSVKVDGSTIATANYTAEAGSTKITLAPAYLETMSVGSHSIVVVSADGTASTNFTVKAAAQPPVPAKYTVSFNMNGHGTQIADQTVEDGSKAAKPADPKASGYTFGGWYADATFSTKFDFNTAITANTTVYAKWTKNSAAPADPTTPQTGDNSNMLLWVMLLAVSGAALTGTAIYGKKKKYRAE